MKLFLTIILILGRLLLSTFGSSLEMKPLVVIAATPTVAAAPSSIAAHEPVLIIPGTMGTQLTLAANGTEAWPNVGKMITSLSDSYLDDLSLNASGVPTQKLVAADIVREVTTSIGISPLVNTTVDRVFYKNLITTFTSNGYQEGKDLFVVPYDWRLDLASQAAVLAAKINAAVLHSPTGKVNLIAHSMGGLLVKQYLSSITNTSTFIDKVILVGVPQLGAPKVFKVLNEGDDLDITFASLSLLNAQEIKKIAQNMPGLYELLPTRRYVQVAGSYVQDFRNGSHALLSFDQTSAFMTSNPSDHRNASLLSLADAFHRTLDTQAVNAAHVYNIVGCGIPTLSGFDLYDGNIVDLQHTTGDGSVPEVSAMNLANGFNNYFVLGAQTGIDHTALVTDARPLTLIKNIISGSVSSAPLPAGISTALGDCVTSGSTASAPSETSLEFSVHGSVSLNVYDSHGRHTGLLTNGNLEQGIPGSTDETLDGNTFITVPAGDSYKVIAQAQTNTTGTFELKVKGYAGAAVDHEATYLAVPLSSSKTRVELDFAGFSGSTGLKLDRNGDGMVDAVLPPNTVLSGAAAADVTPPTLTLPSLATTITQGSTVTLSFNATDVGSGVALMTATLNGKPVTRGQKVTLTQLGKNTFQLTAIDGAGNPRIAEVDFTVTAKSH